MCGIFGIVPGPRFESNGASLRARIDELYRLSETRGKESSGFAARAGDRISVYKQPLAASELIRSEEYGTLVDSLIECSSTGPFAFVAHSRLVTNGVQTINDNNQPVAKDGLVGVHNGIIVNDAALWERYPHLVRESEVDTEVLLALAADRLREHGRLSRAFREVFGLIEGAASVAVLSNSHEQLVLATNTGSLYYWHDPATMFAFASERFILEQWLREGGHTVEGGTVRQLEAGRGLVLDLGTVELSPFSLSQSQSVSDSGSSTRRSASRIRVIDESGSVGHSIGSLQRCTKCVLPESFPYIKFDDEGVCNYCHSYEPTTVKGKDALAEAFAPYRRNDGRPDCIVAFSGGRDSSYSLHYIKRELGLNPLAYTYDWGMVTDLARRNQARICGKLGIEHVLISADITAKRRNVRKNVEAWMKRPALGMIPLFMAGDKQFFHHANALSKQTGTDLVVFSTCPYETTHFKTAFCGLNDSKGGMYYNFGAWKIARLSWYYMSQYLLNPSYINASLFDTMWAYWSAFFAKHEYLMFFDYLMWDEQEIESTLLDEYDWELAPDTTTTWRIGDGTAAFYNYIYHTVTGFTENDTFRSNQVRAGVMTRERALELIETENVPRWDSMQWYARTIGFDFHESLRAINAIPKLYEMRPIERFTESAGRPLVDAA